MRWRVPPPAPQPLYGAERLRRRFLWWRLLIGGEARWLETAEYVEVYTRGAYIDFWAPDRWRDRLYP